MKPIHLILAAAAVLAVAAYTRSSKPKTAYQGAVDAFASKNYYPSVFTPSITYF